MLYLFIALNIFIIKYIIVSFIVHIPYYINFERITLLINCFLILYNFHLFVLNLYHYQLNILFHQSNQLHLLNEYQVVKSEYFELLWDHIHKQIDYLNHHTSNLDMITQVP